MLDCKTIGFFLKISKEVGKAWRKSNTHELHTPFSASFQTFCVTAHAWPPQHINGNSNLVRFGMNTTTWIPKLRGCFVFEIGCFFFEFWVLRFRDRVLRFRVLGSSFSSFRCFVFEISVLRFRDLGASCFGLRFRVLRFRNYPCKVENMKNG